MVTAAKSNHRMPKKDAPVTKSESRAAADGQASMRTMLEANSTLKNTVDHVVTEWGIARLRGRSLAERAAALIAIAHPDHRDELEREAREAGLLHA